MNIPGITRGSVRDADSIPPRRRLNLIANGEIVPPGSAIQLASLRPRKWAPLPDPGSPTDNDPVKRKSSHTTQSRLNRTRNLKALQNPDSSSSFFLLPPEAAPGPCAISRPPGSARTLRRLRCERIGSAEPARPPGPLHSPLRCTSSSSDRGIPRRMRGARCS